MKVMVLVKASPASEAGEMPGTELLTEMGRFNEALVKAGIATKVTKPRALKAKPIPSAGAPSEPLAPGQYERRDLNTEG